MVTEVEELVGFLASPRQEIRQIALQTSIGYTTGSESAAFKTSGLKPIKDLKILVRDRSDISQNALTALINLSSDGAVVDCLIDDGPFVNLLLSIVLDPTKQAADLVVMLLSNLSKKQRFVEKVLDTTRKPIESESFTCASGKVIDQLMGIFVNGAEKSLNKHANFDYLAYFFADVAMHPKGRTYLTETQSYDNVVPLSKLVVFTEHGSLVRRQGVASTIKNALFNTDAHKELISESSVNLLPYLLLPLMGPEEYDEEETLSMPAEMQFLEARKRRETDGNIITTHLESVLLLTTTKDVRSQMREICVYPIVRELHLAVEDDTVREACERIVNVLKRDDAKEEADEGENATKTAKPRIEEIEADEIVDIA